MADGDEEITAMRFVRHLGPVFAVDMEESGRVILEGFGLLFSRCFGLLRQLAQRGNPGGGKARNKPCQASAKMNACRSFLALSCPEMSAKYLWHRTMICYGMEYDHSDPNK
jgi:hypothetical protein